MLKIKKWGEFQYPRKQFGIWRAAFGLYLSIGYLRVYPYAVELFSRDGAYPDPGFAPRVITPGDYFPRHLLSYDSAPAVKAMILVCFALSVLIMLGLFRRSAAFALWLLAVWQLNRNPLTGSPELEFVNWLIVACIFIPPGEGFGLGPVDEGWRMPKAFYWGGWLVLGLAYTFAGYTKLLFHDPYWLNGSAIYHVLATDNGRRLWYGSFFDLFPAWVFAPVTYGSLIGETLAVIFVAFRRTRPVWWFVATAAHLVALVFVNLGQLTLGMLCFHFFLLDHRWVTFKIEWVDGRKRAEA